MKFIRGPAGGLLWLLAAVLGLVSVILCLTVILLPLGLPLLRLSRRLFTTAVRLMLPGPSDRVRKAGRSVTGRARKLVD